MDRHTDREMEIQTEEQIVGLNTIIQIGRHMGKHMDRQINRLMDRQMDR